MNINLETILPWTAPVRVATKNGDRMLRKAPAERGHSFWDTWNANREALRSAGITVKYVKHDDAGLPVYEILWWLPLDPAVVEAERLRREEERLELKEALEGKHAKLTAEQYARFKLIEKKLLPFQIPSVRRLVKALSTYNGALDASDTGTGKTYASLAAAFILNRPVYVVCPKAVRPSWKRAAAHFGMSIFVCNYELLRRGEQAAVRIVGEGKNEDFQWHLDPTTIIIFDECHRLKDHRTWNCALGLSAIRQKYMVIGLSATAADNPLQMKFSGFLTGCFPEKRFWAWAQSHACKKGRWGMSFEGGVEELNHIHREIFPLHGTRVRIADLGNAFPETQITAECYDTNGNESKINAVYDEMKDEIARLQERMNADTGACILVAMLRARQKAEILKVPAIAAMAQDAVEEGMSVAIFVNFDESADALVAKLKTECVIRGGQSDTVRENNIQGFQEDREKIIICNIKAGGVGVSLHGSPGKRMRLAIICPTWSGQDLKQALGRVHRAGGVKSLQRIFFAAKTIEERICDQVREKIGRIDLLNDGDLKLNENRPEEIIKDIPEPQPQPAAGSPIIPVVHPEEEGGPKEPGMKPRKDPALPAEVITDTHQALKILAGMCDGARRKDEAGFNAMDTAYGKSLAAQATLTPRQVAVALKMLRKYYRQLPVDLRTRLGLTPSKSGKEAKGTPGPLKRTRSTPAAFGGHSAVAIIRACGVAGWDFKRTRAVLNRIGATVADNTIRIQLNAGRKGLAPAAPVDVAGLEKAPAGNPVVQ